MIESSFSKTVMLQAIFRVLSPLIHETLMEDDDFCKEYGILSDTVIYFDNFDFSFRRSYFYETISKCLSGVNNVELLDSKDNKWELKPIYAGNYLLKLELFNNERCFVLRNYTELSIDSATRLKYLEEIVLEVNLPSSAQELWYNILSQRSLVDDEVEAFYNDYNDTPVEQTKSIHNTIVNGHIIVSSLVPTSRIYYERLIGKYDGSTLIGEYAIGSSRFFFDQLLTWKPYEGFLYSLLLSSHSILTTEININKVSCDDLVHAYEFLNKDGDLISKLGAIEIGLRIVTLRPEIEPILINLIRRLCNEDANEQDSDFNLISALFILVDGELSRIRLFTKEPPFYRRLAALSQASLIYRQIVNSDININLFCEWALNANREQFYIQTLCDMRIEPCWNPDYAAASQIMADFMGRIMLTALNYMQNIKNEELTELIFGSSSKSVKSLSQFPSSYYPGPLEGTVDTRKIIPTQFFEAIETQLHSEEVTVKSFIALVNSALIFRIENEQAELAAKTLKVCHYRLSNIEDRPQLIAILNGLATVAAITRSNTLANELQHLVRVYRRDPQYILSIEESIRICLVSAASHNNLIEWRNFISEWLTELAFSDLKSDEGTVFYSYLNYLCHIVPELWITCGRTEAALIAFNSQNC